MSACPVPPFPVVPAARVCEWCRNTHIADVDCTCTVECAVGWCPAGLTVEAAAWADDGGRCP